MIDKHREHLIIPKDEKGKVQVIQGPLECERCKKVRIHEVTFSGFNWLGDEQLVFADSRCLGIPTAQLICDHFYIRVLSVRAWNIFVRKFRIY
jgi:hypothetical protein